MISGSVGCVSWDEDCGSIGGACSDWASEEEPASHPDRGPLEDPPGSMRVDDGVVVGPLPTGKFQATRLGTGPATWDAIWRRCALAAPVPTVDGWTGSSGWGSDPSLARESDLCPPLPASGDRRDYKKLIILIIVTTLYLTQNILSQIYLINNKFNQLYINIYIFYFTH